MVVDRLKPHGFPAFPARTLGVFVLFKFRADIFWFSNRKSSTSNLKKTRIQLTNYEHSNSSGIVREGNREFGDREYIETYDPVLINIENKFKIKFS